MLFSRCGALRMPVSKSRYNFQGLDSCYNLLIAIVAFGFLQTQGKDLLVVLSDSGKLSFLTFCTEMHRLLTLSFPFVLKVNFGFPPLFSSNKGLHSFFKFGFPPPFSSNKGFHSFFLIYLCWFLLP